MGSRSMIRKPDFSDRNLGIALVIPAVLVVLAINLYPILYAIVQSLYSIRGLLNQGFVGFENYLEILGSPRLWRSLGATAYFSIGTVTVQTVLGIAIAQVLNVSFRGNNLVRASFIIPWAIPASLGALMWKRFLSSTDGYVNALLRMTGLLDGDMNWFLNPVLAMFVVILVDTWKNTPLYAIIFLAALQGIPAEIYESAGLEGASRWQKFRFITLPILKPIIGMVVVLRTMLVFQAFDAIYILTSGGPGDSTRVIAYYAYQEAFLFLQFGKGASLSVILFILTIIITVIYSRLISFSSKETDY
ncbi:sugar ABC transporter permease [Treponema sp.]